jgi:sugar O-acyltransferase (sialic acid O-acetyltransferase NeuD family)
MNDLVLFGTGGFGREALQIVRDLNAISPDWNFHGFLDDDPDKVGHRVHEFEVLGGPSWLEERPGVQVAIAVGGPAAKRRIAERLDGIGVRWATLVHPLAWLGANVAVGEGSIVCAGVRATTDIVIGRHVILNLNVTVGHDSVLGDFATVNPTSSISGNVRVRDGVEVGTGVQIIPGVEVGAWSILGAGTVVTKDTPANATVVGVPGQVAKFRDEGWHL